MRAYRGHRVSGALIAAVLLLSPFLMDCGKKGMPGEMDKVPGAENIPGECPANIADADAVMKANFGLQAELEGKVKAALAAGANLQKLAAEVEGEVAAACGKLAKDSAPPTRTRSRRTAARARRRKRRARGHEAHDEFKAKAKGSLQVHA